MKIRILLVDDHRLLREMLRTFLTREPDIDIVGEACDGCEALRLLREHAIDVVVLDISMPSMNGITAAARMLARYPQLKVIALSMHADRQNVMGMIKAGAIGYVTKTGRGEELLRAIHAATQGQSYLSSEVAAVMVSAVKQRAGDGVSELSVLGRREREVLQLTVEGHRSKAVAEQMSISTSTVETHRRNIMRKLGINSVAELTKYAIREGLTSP